MSWIAPRLFAVPTGGSDDPFLVGPDRKPDLRSRRPYFLLPVLGRAQRHLRTSAINRIRDWLKGSGKPITDVFVLSHGWHRNFFSAMAAYDRIVARLTQLIGRGAIDPPPGFNPLFIAVHWHSDPGQNLWLDKEGRRSKRGFMANVRETFELKNPALGEATLDRDFELMFDLLSTLSAPDTEASDPRYAAEAQGLAAVLDTRYELRSSPGACLDRKTTALWTCYTYSPPRKVVLSQDQEPSRFVRGLQGLGKLGSFVLSVVPLVTLLGLVINLPIPKYSVRDVRFVVGPAGRPVPEQSVRRGTVRDAVALAWRGLGESAMALPHANDVRSVLPRVPYRAWVHIAAGASCAVLSLVLLWAVGFWHSVFRAGKASHGIPWLAMVPWLYLQLIFAAPVLLFDLVTFLIAGLGIGPLFQWLRLISDERTGLRDRPSARVPTLNIGWLLACIARYPLRLLRSAVAVDSRATTLADAIDCQLAYYDMQRRGVTTGVQLGEALAELFHDCPELAEAKLHLAGHSFGAVVVSNAARDVSHRTAFRAELRTVTLLNGAIASGWYEREATVRDRVSGGVTAVYSRYDTANGFWYPLASVGRQAAGSVGICGDFTPEKHEMPPMLVCPPPLHGTPRKPCRMINVDGSRLMYAGAAALGGGHGDIDKDDVMHVLWSATRV